MSNENELLHLPQSVFNLLVLKQLADINEKLEKRVAFLKVEDAVDNFVKNHLSRVKPKTRANYQILIDKFLTDFRGRNLADSADITPDVIVQFFERHWGDSRNNTKTQNFIMLKSFINRCRQYQIRRGLPDFLNPCDALRGKYTKSDAMRGVEFTDETIPMIQRFIESANNERMRATFIVLCTSGMRANEICNARKPNINGQIITLWDHKGIRYNTHSPKPAVAVIPRVASEMIEQMNTDRPFISYRSLWNAIKAREKQGIIPEGMVINDFRKIVATYWHRKGEHDMKNFVLRHRSDKAISTDPLDKIYIAPITIEQAIEKMKILEADFGL